MELGPLLQELEKPFSYLVYKWKLNAEDREDALQDLRCMVIENYPGNEDKGVPWWFIRGRWFMLNKLKKSFNDPLDKSISIDSFFSHCEN